MQDSDWGYGKLKNIAKLIDHPAIPFIASAAVLSAFLVPADWYAFKVIAIIIYTVLINRDNIVKLVLKNTGKGDEIKEGNFQLLCGVLWFVPLILSFVFRQYFLFFAITAFVVLSIPLIMEVTEASKAQNKFVIQKKQVIDLLVILAGIAFVVVVASFSGK